MAIRGVRLLRQNRRPCLLHVVEHERDELNFLVLFGRLLHRPRLRRTGDLRAVVARSEEREKVFVEEQAEDEQDDRPAASDRRAADAESAAAARSAPVFNVAAAARCPSHTERGDSRMGARIVGSWVRAKCRTKTRYTPAPRNSPPGCCR